MVTARHFDVVVLGRSIGALAAAALLARRDFTVLVLGQSEKPPTYKFESHRLHRRAFTLLSAYSPAFRRVVVELAQSQTWKRRMHRVEPMMQVLAPGRRIDVPPDMALFGREIDRECPELRRLVDELYTELARVNGSADDAFAEDAVWPPGTFWERRETGRYAAMLPHVRAEPDADLLVEFPRGHFFRQIVNATALFATDCSSLPPPFAVARLHGGWTRGLLAFERGADELEELLVERIEAHGGRVLFDDRAVELRVRRGAVEGVVLDGAQNPTGATFVVTDLDGESLASLAGGEGIHKRAQREWPRITSSIGRFVASIVVRAEGLPQPLGHESFVLPAYPAARSKNARLSSSGIVATRPLIHLQRHAHPSASDLAVLVAEILLPDRGAFSPLDARQIILQQLSHELPFLERHLVVVDSVHDGLPIWVFENGERRSIARSSVKGLSIAPEPMVRQLEVDPPGYLALGGEPIRGPIERTLLVGRSVLPGLGQEGQLLAAWGAARLVTRTDKQKERMRREMWSKVEIG